IANYRLLPLIKSKKLATVADCHRLSATKSKGEMRHSIMKAANKNLLDRRAFAKPPTLHHLCCLKRFSLTIFYLQKLN
uniref:Uncharacterized protein n=1 Tax=Romanomermis culicivorax TaxID=13658 RepID=A0A915HGR6_ROMCU